MRALRRSLVVGGAVVALTLPTAGIAAAQEEPDPEQPPPTVVDCAPFSILCGLQIGPFGPFYFEFLEGGSVFPPQPPPPD